MSAVCCMHSFTPPTSLPACFCSSLYSSIGLSTSCMSCSEGEERRGGEEKRNAERRGGEGRGEAGEGRGWEGGMRGK